MSKTPKDLRIPIMMSASEVDAIDTWRFENRIATRAEAVRRLCLFALSVFRQADRIDAVAELGRRSIQSIVEHLRDDAHDTRADLSIMYELIGSVASEYFQLDELRQMINQISKRSDTTYAHVAEQMLIMMTNEARDQLAERIKKLQE